MTQGMIPTREWHVLKYIIVMAGIKVTLTPVINWTGQLQHTGSVKCEEVWKKIPQMFQDSHTWPGGRMKVSTSRSHLGLRHLIITLKGKSALSSSYNVDDERVRRSSLRALLAVTKNNAGSERTVATVCAANEWIRSRTYSAGISHKYLHVQWRHSD